MFSVHTTPEKLKKTKTKTKITGNSGFVFEKARLGKPNGYRDAIVFEKLRFQNLYCPQEHEKLAFSISSG